ncbi:MAG: penicillin acylase family protein, partial [Paracoccaceae bacterium]|nr:penicillin acylase family protein [Paracoccaceae bacterium]
MTLLFRWLLRLFLGISALGLAALFAIYVLASRSIPEYSADFQVAKLDAPLEIVRNNANVPHIFGQTDNDAYFGLGFVHAQDRLWQMMMLRRTAQGRLSEIFGEQTLKTDIFMRQMDFYNLAVKSVSALDPETLGLLQAYADGVNAWLDQVNQGALGRGAPEFFMFSNAIAPWQPADSLVIIKLMAIQMSDNLTNEILRARTSLVLGPNRLRDLLPDDAGAAVAELPEYAALWPQLDRYAALATGPDASGYA